MRIELNKCEHMGDWYTIVRSEHDGREWFKPFGHNGLSFQSSERLTPDACIEGDASEMLALARAIKDRSSASFKRCAVWFEADGVHFCSPKNSTEDAIIPEADANDFADRVIAELEAKQ